MKWVKVDLKFLDCYLRLLSNLPLTGYSSALLCFSDSNLINTCRSPSWSGLIQRVTAISVARPLQCHRWYTFVCASVITWCYLCCLCCLVNTTYWVKRKKTLPPDGSDVQSWLTLTATFKMLLLACHRIGISVVMLENISNWNQIR